MLRFVASLSALALCASVAGLVGCNKIPGDCRTVCTKAKDCLVADLDVDGCTRTCKGKKKLDSFYNAKVDDCAECVAGSKTCQATNACEGECLRLFVPQQTRIGARQVQR